MRSPKAPSDFKCLYQHACPYLEGISTRWAWTVYQEQWRLEEQIRVLEADNDRLQEENQALSVENSQIKAKFAALHKKQFKANNRKSLPPTPERSPEPKKRGAPVGHPPWNRPVPTHVDKVVPVTAPTVCPHCACNQLSPSAEIIEQLQEDIVIRPQTLVTRFRHDTAFCPRCRRPVYATAPGELRNCQIGPTTKAVGVWLHHQLKLPFRQVQTLFSTLFGMSFVPASALSFSLTAAEKGQPLYEDLREKIRSSMLLHLDETSWRLDGLSSWLWYAGNADLDFFHIDRSRATDVIASILGDDFKGDIVSDGYAVYDAIIARWRQTCLAHIIRTAKEIASELLLIDNPEPYRSDIDFANSIAAFFSDVCKLDHQRREGSLSRKHARNLVVPLRRRLQSLCSVTLSHPKTLNLHNRLLLPDRDANKLFTFLACPGMPPTNNHAERALRNSVLARKISFGSRSNEGAHAFAVLASLIGTAHRQHQPALNFLLKLFTEDSVTAQAALYQNSA